MTRKQIDTLHEVRLTFVQVVVPIGIGLVYLNETHPSWKYDVKKKFVEGKNFIKDKAQSFKNH